MSATKDAIPLPFGEMVTFLLAVAVLITVASWLIVRAHRRRLRRRG